MTMIFNVFCALFVVKFDISYIYLEIRETHYITAVLAKDDIHQYQYQYIDLTYPLVCLGTLQHIKLEEERTGKCPSMDIFCC